MSATAEQRCCGEPLFVLNCCWFYQFAPLLLLHSSGLSLINTLTQWLKSLILGELAEWLRSGLQKVALTLKLEKIPNIIKGLS